MLLPRAPHCRSKQQATPRSQPADVRVLHACIARQLQQLRQQQQQRVQQE